MAGEADVEPTPDAIAPLERRADPQISVRRQARIRMEKQQHVAARDACARVHLRGATRRCHENPVGERAGRFRAAIAAAAIDDYDLRTSGPEGLQPRQVNGQGSRFIQNWDNDGTTQIGLTRFVAGLSVHSRHFLDIMV